MRMQTIPKKRQNKLLVFLVCLLAILIGGKAK